MSYLFNSGMKKKFRFIIRILSYECVKHPFQRGFAFDADK